MPWLIGGLWQAVGNRRKPPSFARIGLMQRRDRGSASSNAVDTLQDYAIAVETVADVEFWSSR